MSTARDLNVLDNPIWNSLLTRHARFAQGGELARRFDPEIGPLAGMKDENAAAYEALGKLLAPGEAVALFLGLPPAPPAGWEILLHKSGDQMVFQDETITYDQNLPIEPLGSADVPEMLELTSLTNPGPFRRRTIELGDFIGIHEGGRLAAMAGERLALGKFREVSGVCTHPDFRGRGYAQALVAAVANSILNRGETPMLHVYSDNLSAIRVYEALGFTLRRRFEFAFIAAPERQS
ncbi:MAG TPA: GNAT family N-acetyltransferase [Acidobacteriaceae bacterium]|jgi:ribosomal protein S18 acetylase RimI-like enzyme|nr:GNAT family N-acetyltransferase [Acidobacteriaceae bacterium]